LSSLLADDEIVYRHGRRHVCESCWTTGWGYPPQQPPVRKMQPADLR
jgi:hypothetical protein